MYQRVDHAIDVLTSRGCALSPVYVPEFIRPMLQATGRSASDATVLATLKRWWRALLPTRNGFEPGYREHFAPRWQLASPGRLRAAASVVDSLQCARESGRNTSSEWLTPTLRCERSRRYYY